MTDAVYVLSDAQQVQMLRKLMLFWDGQWFLKTVEAFGLEPAMDLNARVRASFGRIEMRTMLKVLHKRQADDLADALRLLAAYTQAFMGDGLSATLAPIGADRAEITVRRCAAYEGAKRASLPRADQACVACETVWNAWLETLLPGVRINVQYPLRQGKGDAHCLFLIEIDDRGGE
jgi:predicted ArsR family transcriptional regulator